MCPVKQTLSMMLHNLQQRISIGTYHLNRDCPLLPALQSSGPLNLCCLYWRLMSGQLTALQGFDPFAWVERFL